MKKIVAILLMFLMLTTSLSGFAQEVTRDESGNYVLTESDFTELWAEYNRRGRMIEALELTINDRDAVIEGLRVENQELKKENQELEVKLAKSYNTFEVVLLTVGAATLTGVIVYAICSPLNPN